LEGGDLLLAGVEHLEAEAVAGGQVAKVARRLGVRLKPQQQQEKQEREHLLHGAITMLE
jgi:hypothetical protein